KSGVVTGTASAIRIGRTVQVWQIEIHNEKEQLICTSRLTLAVIDKPQKK
ncbi:MAG: PaaI family thioesterase, partial [Psychromonas sp.]|nr:PaaI family thioesterase [Psychromonas sp.]